MSDRPIRVRIDRVVLRNVDDGDVGNLSELVADRLRSGAPPTDDASTPIPRRGKAVTEAAADRVASSVWRAIP